MKSSVGGEDHRQAGLALRRLNRFLGARYEDGTKVKVDPFLFTRTMREESHLLELVRLQRSAP